MASVDDVFKQLETANSSLAQLHNDMVDEAITTKAIRDKIDELETVLRTGFDVLSKNIHGLAALQHQTNELLVGVAQRDDTIICLLTDLTRTNCAILTQAVTQTRAVSSIETDMTELSSIAENVHPGAALDYKRRQDVQREIDRCCPQPEPEPPCVPPTCPEPGKLPELVSPPLPDFSQPLR